MNGNSNHSFYFLDLPTELRLMIYEFLPNRTTRAEYIKSTGKVTSNHFTLITNSAQTAILATCKIIYIEALPIMRKKMRRLWQTAYGVQVAGSAVRIETDNESLAMLCSDKGLLEAIQGSYRAFHLFHIRDPQFTPHHFHMCTSISDRHGYFFKSGSKQEGRQHLIDFVRKAGQLFEYQVHNFPQATSQVMPRIQIALTMHPTYDTYQSMRYSVFRGYTALNESVYNVQVRLHTLDHGFGLADVSLRAVVNALADVEGEHPSPVDYGTYDPTLTFSMKLGVNSYNVFRKPVYDRFWLENEWL